MRHDQPQITEKEDLVFAGGQKETLVKNVSDLFLTGSEIIWNHHTASLINNLQLCSSVCENPFCIILGFTTQRRKSNSFKINSTLRSSLLKY